MSIFFLCTHKLYTYFWSFLTFSHVCSMLMCISCVKQLNLEKLWSLILMLFYSLSSLQVKSLKSSLSLSKSEYWVWISRDWLDWMSVQSGLDQIESIIWSFLGPDWACLHLIYWIPALGFLSGFFLSHMFYLYGFCQCHGYSPSKEFVTLLPLHLLCTFIKSKFPFIYFV